MASAEATIGPPVAFSRDHNRYKRNCHIIGHWQGIVNSERYKRNQKMTVSVIYIKNGVRDCPKNQAVRSIPVGLGVRRLLRIGIGAESRVQAQTASRAVPSRAIDSGERKANLIR